MVIGQFSEGHPTFDAFELAQVLDPTEILFEIRIRQSLLRGKSLSDISTDDSEYTFVTEFAAGHKPSCGLHQPEVRASIPELRERMNERDSVFSRVDNAYLEGILCKCGSDG